MKSIILVVDNVRSTHKVGSFFRMAECFGVEMICLRGTTPTPIDRFGRPRPDIQKVALGAELLVPWTYDTHTMVRLQLLRTEGYALYALEQSDNSILLSQVTDLPEKVALIVGGEVTGVSTEVLDMTDAIIEIPQQGTKESLNVSVAAGIALYALRNIATY